MTLRTTMRPTAPPADHPMVRHVERQAIRMHEMMDRLDVDPVKLARTAGGDAYAEARTRCLHCTDARACLDWLEADAGASCAEPEFCPNLALFRTCRRG